DPGGGVAAVAPVEGRGVGVQRADVREGPAEGQRLPPHPRAGGGPRQGGDDGRHVVDPDGGVAAAAVAVLVRDRRAHGEGAAVRRARRVIEVLVTRAERQHAGGQTQNRVRRAVAPGDVHGVRVQRARVREGPGHRRGFVLVDRGGGG